MPGGARRRGFVATAAWQRCGANAKTNTDGACTSTGDGDRTRPWQERGKHGDNAWQRRGHRVENTWPKPGKKPSHVRTSVIRVRSHVEARPRTISSTASKRCAPASSARSSASPGRPPAGNHDSVFFPKPARPRNLKSRLAIACDRGKTYYERMVAILVPFLLQSEVLVPVQAGPPCRIILLTAPQLLLKLLVAFAPGLR